ncbi:MAG: FAD-binding oxidoreductase [Conexibacter sp.]|nr:FAD-binding oxidoreductase [Conexibacter sp.]
MTKLLSPDPARIGRPPGEPAADRAPDRVALGTPEPLRSQLIGLLGAERVLTRPLDLIRYASDASPYRLIPQAVVMAHDAGDVAKVLGHARAGGTPVTFRGGGTSLSGQGQTDGILVDVRRHWSGVRVEDGGARARVEAGTLLGHANRVLRRHGVALGPDPASKEVATVGGVIANNSGGMRCGTTWDAYSTVESMTLVLASGTTIDTAAPGAEETFAAAEPELARGLIELRDELRADDELAARVRRKFAIKNTTGYRLCALLDADTPLEIFRRLVVGSEGTLAFVAEAVFATRPEPAQTAVAWLHFASIDAAVEPVGELVAAGARAVELMVAPALIAAGWGMPGTPAHWRELPPESAALLVELAGADGDELGLHEAAARRVLERCDLLLAPDFTRSAQEIELAWTVREGLFGLVGRLRLPGTALIVEDVCVAPERIGACAQDLQALLAEHGFLVGVAGHASAGNLHFQLTPDLSKQEDRQCYEAFMERLVALIVDDYDGSLKAEHGTGRNIAPYVAREWGEHATELMWRIKRLADPHGVLNPGVVLNRDPGVHLRDLKTQPPIEEEVTSCVECGFCEPVCPSRAATTTPRQRIVLRRELARQPEGSPVSEALLADFQHDVIETCAADGSCAPACPIGLDVGTLVKRFRRAQRSDREEAVALAVARRFATVERAARGGLRAGRLAARVVGEQAAGAVPAALRRHVSEDLLPAYPPGMPPPAPARLPATTSARAAAVYLPACLNRIFGNAAGTAPRPTLPETLVAVSARAGLPLWIPVDAAGHCCATPWASKGYRRGHAWMARTTADALWRWSDGGRLPVVIDASSCAHGLLTEVADALEDDAARERFASIELLDAVAWAHDRLLPRLTVTRRVGSVALHPTCSASHLGVGGKLAALLATLADEVVVPDGTTCCGMAGDRGLLHPQLPASALRDAAASLAARTDAGQAPEAWISSNRTCELALAQVTGRPYASFVFLLEQATRGDGAAEPPVERGS